VKNFFEILQCLSQLGYGNGGRDFNFQSRFYGHLKTSQRPFTNFARSHPISCVTASIALKRKKIRVKKTFVDQSQLDTLIH